MSYEKGWDDAFDTIADYLDAEVCPVIAEMVRRMKTEDWRFPKTDKQATD